MTDDPFAPPSAGSPWAQQPPPPGYPPTYAGGWTGYPVPEERALSTWALVSLITGIFALVPVAVVCGIVGLVKTRGGALRGKGLAIGGLGAAAGWTVLLTAILALTLASDSGGGSTLGRLADAGRATALGTCLRLAGDEDSVSTAVDCSQDHDAEIYAVVELGPGDWPGYTAISDRGYGVCDDAFASYVGMSVDASDYDYSFFLADQAEWVGGAQRAICVVVPYTQDHLRGSVRDTSNSGAPA